MFSVEPDLDNSNINILHIESSNGLPDRDYYFDTKHKHTLDKYKNFIKKYLNLFGKFDFNNILLIEKNMNVLILKLKKEIHN